MGLRQSKWEGERRKAVKADAKLRWTVRVKYLLFGGEEDLELKGSERRPQEGDMTTGRL